MVCNTLLHMLCNMLCNNWQQFATKCNNVCEGVVRMQQGISGQRDTSLAPHAIRRSNGEIVEKCGNLDAGEGGRSGRLRRPEPVSRIIEDKGGRSTVTSPWWALVIPARDDDSGSG